MRHLIDGGFASGSPARLNATALAMSVVIALLAFATAARFALVTWLGERIGADLRRAVFDHVLRLSPAWFETARTGDVLSRLQADTAVLQALAGSALSQWLRSALLLIGAFGMLVVTSPLLSGLVAAVVPFVVVPLVVFSRRERKLSRVAQDRIADLGALAEETLGALRTVQAFTQEPFARQRFAAATEGAVAAARARIRSRAGVILVVILLGFGAITLALWVGGQQVLAGRLSGGSLSAFVFYAVIVATSGAGLSELWGELQRAAGAADRIAEILGEQPEIAAPPHPRALPSPPRGRVEFDEVTFHYPARPSLPALHRFSLTVEPGETVALVGPSGAGKTTVLQLLLRFYDPLAGAIRLDGVDLREASPADVRARLGLVPQDPVVFGADAWTNIRFGRPDATDAEVQRSRTCRPLRLHRVALPQGWDTFLGEKGVRLSGGQRQRLAIARAVLRDPAVLLLDEATSALDAESEHAVQQALAALSRNRTTLVIAHRLATVRRADRIVVLDDGRIVASGTHESLVRGGWAVCEAGGTCSSPRRLDGGCSALLSKALSLRERVRVRVPWPQPRYCRVRQSPLTPGPLPGGEWSPQAG